MLRPQAEAGLSSVMADVWNEAEILACQFSDDLEGAAERITSNVAGGIVEGIFSAEYRISPGSCCITRALCCGPSQGASPHRFLFSALTATGNVADLKRRARMREARLIDARSTPFMRCECGEVLDFTQEGSALVM